ncbi:hypothetical protein [Streptomyces odontomachi]|uniref:hypothetical protein n=1 Tax=Streptomyces odontomachi TaxID=2944940 RepID=UPI002108F774|nr:hypothetical protein [Streptomyces sp. ODS25]
MKSTRRVTTALGGALLAFGALLAVTPGATAATGVTAQAQAQASTLAPPTLTSVTRNGDNMIVIWKPSPSQGVAGYEFIADGRVVKQPVNFNPGSTDPEDKAFVAVASTGLTGNETYSVAAVDSAGNVSAPSNTLKAVAPVTLTPTPEMQSAVIKGDQVTLTWTQSHTDEVSGELWYTFAVNGKPYKVFQGVRDATTATLPISDDDPVDPTAFGVGSKVTVVATDYTGMNSSAAGTPVTVTAG